jgi:hypothetical protein
MDAVEAGDWFSFEDSHFIPDFREFALAMKAVDLWAKGRFAGRTNESSDGGHGKVRTMFAILRPEGW